MRDLAVRIFQALLALGLFALLGGCFSSSVPVKQYSELEQADWEMYPIRALTTDTTTYTFDAFSFTDSTISGTGSRTKGRHTEEFQDTLAFSDIVFIEQLKPNTMKTIWFAPMAASLVLGFMAMTVPSDLSIQRPIEGSCPFIYAYDGSEFKLEAEAFSTAISRALETETFHLLPSLAPASDGELRVRVKNERPETHLINSIHLFVADAGEAPEVALDIENRLWPVGKRMPPAVAYDHLGNNIQRELANADGQYWKSDLKRLPAHAPFEDTVVAKFEIPPGTSEATLVLDAINSHLINEVYSAVGSIIGDKTMEFYQALEHDPILQELFQYWIRKSSLRVEMWDGQQWSQEGLILPEANEVPFRRAVRLQNLNSSSESIKIRVSSMTDVWHIDALSLDYLSPEQPLTPHPLEMTVAETSYENSEVKKAIGRDDSLYTMTLPPHYIDIRFDGTTTMRMQRPIYILAARGFLYEWFPQPSKQFMAGSQGWLEGAAHDDMIKLFRQQEALFLRAVYERWSQENRSGISGSSPVLHYK